MASSMIELIKVLRDRTGAGNMDCKKALEACELDVDKAVDYLREKGIAKAAKKATRIAAEGLCAIESNGNKAAIVEVNCETDFVSRGDLFKELVNDTCADVLANDYKDIDDAKTANNERYLNATMKIGEKLDFRRFAYVTKQDGESFGTYLHTGNQIGVIVVLDKDLPEEAFGIAMHVAANNPTYICPKCIPGDVIEHERKIAIEASKDDPKLAGKPEAVIAKIIDGKVNKILGEQVLLNQVYLLDDSVTVSQHLDKLGAHVVSMTRFAVGEGIEKREENFAEEVAKQMA